MCNNYFWLEIALVTLRVLLSQYQYLLMAIEDNSEENIWLAYAWLIHFLSRREKMI